MLGDILNALPPMALAWLVALLIFLAAEAITVSLVSIWFAGGSLAALIATGFHAPIWLQIGLFLLVSVAMLALLRPFAKKLGGTRHEKTNADRHIGRQALVCEEIDNLHETGAVQLDGVIWTARSENDQVIPKGAMITVLRMTGAKVWVEQAAPPEEKSE